MKNNNYEVINRYGKLSVRNLNKNRNIRIERQFGSDYSIDRINERRIEEVPDKLTMEDQERYNYYKRNYIKNPKSIIAKILYFILKIETYQKSQRNYPISAEMKKEIDKLEKYNLQVRFLTENKIDSLEELNAFHEMNKELLNNIQYERKKNYELKSKTKDIIVKEECDSKVDFYNEMIKDLQTKVKTCRIVEDTYKVIKKELSSKHEYLREVS